MIIPQVIVLLVIAAAVSFVVTEIISWGDDELELQELRRQFERRLIEVRLMEWWNDHTD